MLKTSKSLGSKLAKTGVVACVYAVATMLIAPLSYGSIQLRFSEALTILPLFMPESVIGLFIGCLIANLLGNGLIDVIFGSLATLVAAVLTYLVGKFIKNEVAKVALGGFFPVIINAIVIPFTYLLITELPSLYFLNFLTVFVGQFIAVYLFGTLLYLAIKKHLKNAASK